VAVFPFQATTGSNQYVFVLNLEAGTYWNGTAFEAFNAANWVTYAVTATEYGSTGVFRFTIPASLPAGFYSSGSKTRVTGSPLQGDPNGAGGWFTWNGSKVVGAGDAAVATVAPGAITADSIASDAITEAKIATPAEAAGNPTGVLGMVRRVWEWRERKRTRDRATGVVSLRNAADSGDLVTATQSTAGDVDTQTAAS
jgi:hypothetical protein